MRARVTPSLVCVPCKQPWGAGGNKPKGAPFELDRLLKFNLLSFIATLQLATELSSEKLAA